LGKPRGDPSLPPITLRPLPQSVAQAPEPERAPHPPARLPDKPATPPRAVEEAPEDEEPEDPNASDLLKSAATQLQRLVWRLKKE
jgi:hypothetical protein